MLQEALSTKRFGKTGERFPALETLNGVQCVACYLWAAMLLLVFPDKPGARPAPAAAYLRAAVTNSIGPACGILALRNISYPAQARYVPLRRCHFRLLWSQNRWCVAVTRCWRSPAKWCRSC